MSATLRITLALVVAIVLTPAGLSTLRHQPLAQPPAVACDPSNPSCGGDRQNLRVELACNPGDPSCLGGDRQYLPVELACNLDNPSCGGDRQNLPVELG